MIKLVQERSLSIYVVIFLGKYVIKNFVEESSLDSCVKCVRTLKYISYITIFLADILAMLKTFTSRFVLCHANCCAEYNIGKKYIWCG